MLRATVSFGAKSALVIDDIDPSGTPSLIGFWKCHDVDLTTDTMPDHSMYGHDLSVSTGEDINGAGSVNSSRSVSEMLTTRPGWFTVKSHDKAIMSVTGTPLDTQDKVVLVAAEMIYEAGMDFPFTGPDIDVGTSHDIAETLSAYKGFMIGGAYEDNYFRVTIIDGATIKQWKAPAVGGNYGGGYHVDPETEFVVAGSFAPGVAVYGSVSRCPVQTSVVSEAGGYPISQATSLVAQDGKFAIRGVNPFQRTSIRNLQVWSWDAAAAPSADVLKNTVEWMNYNPGKIPAWLVGR